MREAYKVVRDNDDGSYSSLIIKEGPYCLRYAIGEKTEAPPETSGVCCFLMPSAVQRFIQEYGWWTDSSVRILKVQPHGHRRKPRLLWAFMSPLGRVVELTAPPDWQGPEGTVCYKAITPLEEVTL